jgi:hypothetical protein
LGQKAETRGKATARIGNEILHEKSLKITPFITHISAVSIVHRMDSTSDQGRKRYQQLKKTPGKTRLKKKRRKKNRK